MKNTRINKLISIVIALATLLGAFALTVNAALSDNAAEFISAVNAIDSATTLKAKENALAKADNAFDKYVNAGGSANDPSVASAYESYVEKKATIEASIKNCLDFIEYVGIALDTNSTFPVKKENIDKAAELIDKIDLEYETVALYKNYYTTLCAELDEPIRICEMFIAYAKAAAEATTYEEANRNKKNAEAAKGQITIPDYPGLDEAEANLNIAASTMAFAVLNAKPFIDAVRNVNKADTIPLGVKNAYAVYETIDKTAEGVSTALNNLKKIERDYNKSAKSANDIINETTAISFAILFGGK